MSIKELGDGLIFVTRAGWDNSVDFPTGQVVRPASKVFIHHTVTTPTADPCKDARTVEAVLDSRGLDGYSYLSHPSGIILEFAGEHRGEHTAKHNSTSYAFSLIGNYENDYPTLPQLLSIARCINLMRLKGDLVPRLEDIQILPHSAVKATACPGLHVRDAKYNGHTPLEWIRWFAGTGA